MENIVMSDKSDGKVRTKPQKVFVQSLNKVGQVKKVERDPVWGSQFLVSVYSPDWIGDTAPYEHFWVKEDDVIPVKENNKEDN
jgi:hypothetical protein